MWSRLDQCTDHDIKYWLMWRTYRCILLLSLIVFVVHVAPCHGYPVPRKACARMTCSTKKLLFKVLRLWFTLFFFHPCLFLFLLNTCQHHHHQLQLHVVTALLQLHHPLPLLMMRRSKLFLHQISITIIKWIGHLWTCLHHHHHHHPYHWVIMYLSPYLIWPS